MNGRLRPPETAAFPSGRVDDNEAAGFRGKGDMLRSLYDKLRSAFAARPMPGPPTESTAGRQARQRFDERLLAVLACPSSHEALRYDAAAGELVADRAGLAYRIEEGIPILLVAEARRVAGDEAEG